MIQLYIRPQPGRADKRVAHRISSEPLHHLQRIDPVAQRLGHAAPLRVSDRAVQQNIREGQISHELESGHHHARYPEEQDLRCRAQRVRRIEGRHVRRVIRPTQCAEGPQPGTEPRVQYIRILVQASPASVALRRIIERHDNFAALLAIPHGDPVPPPELATDAPVPDIRHPVLVRVAEALRVKPQSTLPVRRQRWLRQGLHADEPLQAETRLHNRVAPVAVSHRMLVILHLDQESEGFQVLEDPFPGHEPVQPTIRLRSLAAHRRIAVHNVDAWKIVSQPNLEVVRIVSWRHLDEAGSELGIHILVRNDSDAASDEGQVDVAAHEVPVPLVSRVYSDRRVTEHSLRPRGRDDYELAFRVGEGIPDVVQPATGLLVLRLLIGERRKAAGAPVDDVVAPVDQPLVVQTDEHLSNRSRQPLVEGEPGPVPVARAAHRLQLLDDCRTVLVNPAPDPLDETFPAQVVACQPLPGHVPLDHVLRGNACVIGAGNPHGTPTPHSVESDENILNRVVQAVPHVQRGGNVGGRYGYDVRVPGFFRLYVEASPFDPASIDGSLDPRGIKTGGQFVSCGFVAHYVVISSVQRVSHPEASVSGTV